MLPAARRRLADVLDCLGLLQILTVSFCRTCNNPLTYPEWFRHSQLHRAQLPYDTSIDVVPILRSTLSLLERSIYRERDSPPILLVIDLLRDTIAELEIAKRLPDIPEPPASAPRTASAKARPE